MSGEWGVVSEEWSGPGEVHLAAVFGAVATGGVQGELEAIAAEAGYGSLSEFRTAFKKRYGVSPAMFRRSQSGAEESAPDTLQPLAS